MMEVVKQEPEWSPYPMGNGWHVDPFQLLDAHAEKVRKGEVSDVVREAYERKLNS